MWLLILAHMVLAVGADDASNGTVAFPKCCPDGESLIKKTDEDISIKYSCVNRELLKSNYSVEVHSLVLGENIVTDYGMPEDCDKLLLTKVGEEISMRSNHCYDTLALEVVNGTLKSNIPQVVSLTCATQQKNDTKDYQINNIRKCCPVGQSYDVDYHVCRNVVGLDNERWLNYIDSTGGKYIFELELGLNCKPKEFAVELTEEHFSLTVEGSNLKASRLGETKAHSVLRGEWCADLESSGRGLVARACTADCASFGAFCMKKCCPIGYHYEPRQCGSTISNCRPNTDDPTLYNLSYYLDPLKTDPDYDYDVTGIQISLYCPKGKYLLNRTAAMNWHRLAANGKMVIPSSLGPPTHDYCIESFDNRRCGNSISPDVLLCFADIKINNFFIPFVAMCISCVFLFLTLVVYCALPELRNLHGHTLICHVAMLLLAYCCLARVKYGYVDSKSVCRLLGYMIYFGFVAAFAWLNVMCLDIWRTFGSVTVQPMNRAGAERKRFAWYSLYAWSVSFGMTVTMLLLDLYPVTSVLTAHIGRDFCWFGSEQNAKTDWSHYIFFVIPMGIVTCVNFVLWVLTARHCHRVKSEVHRLQAGSVGDRVKRRFRADRARYVLTGKLWVVMGAGWVWELLSTLVAKPAWLWDSIDFINELQGVWIFLILVLKPKLYYLIRKRLGLEKPDERKNGTSSTFLSRTISSDERANQRISLTATKEKQ